MSKNAILIHKSSKISVPSPCWEILSMPLNENVTIIFCWYELTSAKGDHIKEAVIWHVVYGEQQDLLGLLQRPLFHRIGTVQQQYDLWLLQTGRLKVGVECQHASLGGTKKYSYDHQSCNWRAHFQNVLNPLLRKIEFLASLYRITLELVTEWNLDLDNSRKYIFFSM